MEKFTGLYDSTHAIITAICEPMLGTRAAKSGDEVIVMGIGCEAFFPALHYRGLLPVFIDINLDTLLPDLDVLETVIVEGKTKALIYPYPFGSNTDKEEIQEICNEYEIFLIDISGNINSLIGDMSLVYSRDCFYVSACCNPILESSIKSSKKYIIQETLKNCEGTNVEWSYLYDFLIEYRKYFRFQSLEKDVKSSGFSVIVKETSPFDSGELQEYLNKKGINTSNILSGTFLRQPSYKQVKHVVFQDLVNSDVIQRDGFWIPLRQHKKEEYIVKTIKEFVEGYK